MTKQAKETVEFEYAMGVKVRDRVTKIEGVIDMRAQYLNGCIRYSVQPEAKEVNPEKMPASYWIDEAQLEYLNQGLNAEPVVQSPTGGPTESSAGARM